MEKSKFKIILDGILIPFVIYFFITMIVSMVFVLINGGKNPNAVLVQGIADIFVFAALYPLYVAFKNRYNVVNNKFDFKSCLYMIPLALSICVIGNILVDYIPRETENMVTTEVYNLAKEYNIFLSLFIVSVLIPIIEELLFRGFFYDAAKILANDIVAIIFTSFAFAIAHFELRQSLYAFFAGLFLGYIKYKYKNIIYTIVTHLLMNFFTLVIVPTILITKDIRTRAYALLICAAMLIFTMYRINMKKNIS
ncbi:MAG: CPBP family intramembrane metalloprotease [Lachnospiraceae bacterium]|nr:CPBP family intramembrane metalloprotease [Lachnospiraceae bacterium]